MAKNKTEIHVTTVFDGELDATDVFVSLISQKYGKTNTKEYLAKKKDISYNEDEVQKSQRPYGLCGQMAMMNEMEYRKIGSALARGYRAAVYCRL